MATSLRLYHGQHFSLDTVITADDAKKLDPAEVFTVETATGPSARHRQAVKAKGGYTDVDLPDGYPGSPIEWAHFEQAITDRHAATDWIKSVAMRPGGDAKTTARVAAVFEADVIDWKDS